MDPVLDRYRSTQPWVASPTHRRRPRQGATGVGGGVGVGVAVGVLVGAGVEVLVGAGVGVLVGVGVGGVAETATQCLNRRCAIQRIDHLQHHLLRAHVPKGEVHRGAHTGSVELSTESLHVYLQGHALVGRGERPSKVTGCPVAGDAGDHVKAATVGP